MARLKATIVVDTNVMLDGLDFVKALYAQAAANSVELLLPRELIRELDRIKDREKQGSKLGSQAREAINWISSVLVAQDPDDELPPLRGQKITETLEGNLRHDDAILDCALFNRTTKRVLTILLSNDHNLSNRAVIDGLETLDNSAGVTVARVYDAIAQRTMNEMETDDWPQWSAPQSPPPLKSPSPVAESRIQQQQPPPAQELEDAEMMLEPPPPPTSAIPPNSPLPRPAEGNGMQERVLKSLGTLVDWYIKRSYTEEELDLFNYRQPSTSAEISRALKQFSTVFWDAAPRETLDEFAKAVKSRQLDKHYIMSHVELLMALAGHDRAYKQMLSEYI